MRLAVLDLGSNSFHLLVVEVRADGSFERIAREKVVLRLGEALDESGRLADEAVARAVEAAAQLKAIADAASAAELTVVATHALRAAANGDDVAEQLAAALDAPVRVLDGDEEAAFTFEAIRASVLIDPGPALAFDLGGGSLEIMVGDRAGMRWSRSVELGAGRLTGELLSHGDEHKDDDGPTADELRTMRRRVRQVLAPLVAEVRSFRPTMLVGSSGTICTLARAVLAEERGEVPSTVHQASFRLDDLEELEPALAKAATADRARVPGVDAKRAPTIAAGFVVITTAMEVFGFDELTASEWALREGVVLDAIGHLDPSELAGDPRAMRVSSVRTLCHRCSFSEAHSRQVASLATELFDLLRPVHGLGTDDRELLEHAAWLHDIGEHVDVEGHERHSAYLVEHGRLRGFTPDEVAALASVCRFHRRGTPKPSAYEPFAGLGDEWRDRVVRLVALLRVADALDRSRSSRVRLRGVEVGQKEISLVLDASGDTTVELFGLERKQELFERTFGRRLAVDLGGAQAAAH